MNFEKAWKEMINKGNKVKLPSWGGYWEWNEEKQNILIHEKDGNIVEFNSPKMRVKYSIENMLRNDWVIADSDNCPLLGGIAKFGIEDAVRYAKRGLKIRMDWWPKEKYVNFCKVDAQNIENETSYIFSNIEDESYFYRTIDAAFVIVEGYIIREIFNRNLTGYWTWFNEETKEIKQEELDTNSKPSTGVTFDHVDIYYLIEEVVANILNNKVKFRLNWWPTSYYVDNVTDLVYDGNKLAKATFYSKGTISNPYGVKYFYVRNETEVFKSITMIGSKTLLKPDMEEHEELWEEFDMPLGSSSDMELSKIQEYIESVAPERGIDKVSLPNEVLMLAEEVGEVCKAVRQFVKTSPNDKHSKQRALADEIADVFIVLLNICIKSNIDLYDAFINKELINRTRKWE